MPPPRLPKWMPAQTYRPMTERFKQYISTVALASALALYPAMTSAEELGVDSAADIRTASFTDAPSETSRPVTGCYSLEFGRRSVVSQYLAPVTYAGTRYAVSGRWEKCMPFAPQSAMMAFEAHVDGALSLLNPRQNSSMQAIDADFAWNMRGWWRLPQGFAVSAGGGLEVEAGALALLKNINNPVSVNVAAAVEAAASVSWTHRFWRVPTVVTLNLRTPLLGAFYMPGYGETYYEMYLGNHAGLVHCGWPGNRRKVNLHLGIRLDLGRTAMELGYRLDWQRASANNLVYRSSTNAFTIGVIPGGLGMKRPASRQIRPF